MRYSEESLQKYLDIGVDLANRQE